MAKVVYLLGAGASRGKRHSDYKQEDANREDDIIEGLPVVSEIPDRLTYVINLLSKINIDDSKYSTFRHEGAIDTRSWKEYVLGDLTWLRNECQRHATIDTFAKKLYLTKRMDEYDKVKKMLALYFSIEQIINKTDFRYDTFLASVLGKDLRIPGEICIITWNYDSLIELALKEYYKFRHPSDIGCYSIKDNIDDYRNACIFKVNGTASFDTWNSYAYFTDTSIGNLQQDDLIDILKSYFKDKVLLSFAWEQEESLPNDSFFKAIAERTKEATTLVVIGYTFPFFNRKTDKLLLEKMPNLKQIYIQDPKADMLVGNVEAVIPTNRIYCPQDEKIKIIPLKGVDQFHLPYEL